MLALPVDLTDETQVGQAVERNDRSLWQDSHWSTSRRFDWYKAAVDYTLDDWNAEIKNNLLTAFLCSRAAFLPHA